MLKNVFAKFLMCGFLCATLGLNAGAQTKYKYTYFQASPKETAIFVTAINNAGTAVGLYNTTVSGTTVTTGFQRTSTGTISKVVDPNSNLNFDRANGINNNGEITGDYFFTNGLENFYRGYTDVGGTFTAYNVDVGQSTNVYGVNDSGSFVGLYYTGAVYHGFVNIAGTVTDIDYPSALYTYPDDINNAGQICGEYYDGTDTYHGFLANSKGKILGTLNYPGATNTYPGGINNHNEVVGYYEDSSKVLHGFTYKGGVYTAFNAPGAADTVIFGINDSGQLGGYVITSTGAYKGFIATPQ
jgi:hypothetical protein